MAIANLLNDEGIPAFNGGIWYSATVYHVLQNETYTGRTLYRRTMAKLVREPATGKKHRKVTVRDQRDWIEVPDVTPAIVDLDTFMAAQRILDDPERRRRGKRKREYPLSGRLRCLRCGRAMVGQTLQGRYKYYKCRRSYADPTTTVVMRSMSVLAIWKGPSNKRCHGFLLIQRSSWPSIRS